MSDIVGGTDEHLTRMTRQPWFGAWQSAFALAAGGLVTMGVLEGQLSGLNAVTAAAIPVIALLAAQRIRHRLRSVRAERPFDASDALLARAIFVIESLALLALGVVAVP